MKLKSVKGQSLRHVLQSDLCNKVNPWIASNLEYKLYHILGSQMWYKLRSDFYIIIDNDETEKR